MTSKYSFYHLPNKEATGLNSKEIQEYILKWSMKKCLSIAYYAFNQEFCEENIDLFILDFFQDSNVAKTLQIDPDTFLEDKVAKVKIEEVPCTVTSMAFFDRLLDSQNNVVCNGQDKEDNHLIRLCMEDYKHGIYITNNLKMMLLDDECEEYALYDREERAEFIFRLFKHLVVGGIWCQDDTIIEPYLDATKSIYKDLLAVEKMSDSKQPSVASRVYRVVALNSNNTVIFPKAHTESADYSFAYLTVYPKTRTVALLVHNVGSTIYV
ncbi:cilia- and flagella-associated protein 300-like [Adelges cooleyi]|uniref:cilia- and flagella-associated protein 300-like n=1 Tax=Adelges cooleyi TaxID=133065 RepID=UPI0021808915|nr:cilia- and flagella-associated protein 300-like [Adelges cooleyi]